MPKKNLDALHREAENYHEKAMQLLAEAEQLQRASGRESDTHRRLELVSESINKTREAMVQMRKVNNIQSAIMKKQREALF